MPSNRKIIRDEIVPAGAPWGGTRKKDQRLRIVDCEPRQAVDFLCYNELEAAMVAVAVLSNARESTIRRMTTIRPLSG